MKRLLLILLCSPMIGSGQTYVPDDNFEQALINMGYDNVLDDYVTTANIDTVTSLILNNAGGVFPISDLTGLEDFIALEFLHCQELHITSLDLSDNIALTELRCFWNTSLTTLNITQNTALITLDGFWNTQLSSLNVTQNTALTKLLVTECNLSSLDVSQNTALTELICNRNSLTSLDVSQNTALIDLACGEQYITTLDLSNNTNLEQLECWAGQLTSLDLRNTNNINMTRIELGNNPNLYCISVDNSIYSTNNWNLPLFEFDPQHYFSNNCSGTTSIQEHSKNKELFKTIDILGREAKGTKNESLFYIYDDGTVQKKIIIE